MAENDTLAEFLAQHPRLIGALVMITLLLTNAGAAVAANGTTIG